MYLVEGIDSDIPRYENGRVIWNQYKKSLFILKAMTDHTSFFDHKRGDINSVGYTGPRLHITL